MLVTPSLDRTSNTVIILSFSPFTPRPLISPRQADLTPERLYWDYARRGRPVIISGALDADWVSRASGRVAIRITLNPIG